MAKFWDDESNFALVGLSFVYNLDEWIFYTRYTYHICPYHEWFFLFEELKSRIVYMGNDNACEITRIGSSSWRPIMDQLKLWQLFDMFLVWRSVSSHWEY